MKYLKPIELNEAKGTKEPKTNKLDFTPTGALPITWQQPGAKLKKDFDELKKDTLKAANELNNAFTKLAKKAKQDGNVKKLGVDINSLKDLIKMIKAE